MAERHQVIVVGGGPVGVAMGVDLGLRGVDVVVVGRHLLPQRIPKGQNLSQRTLEHFYFWGVEDELRAARVLPKGYPIGGVTAYKNLNSEYWWAPAGREQVRNYYYVENERLPQYLTEEVLRKRASELPNVTMLYGWTAESIEQDEGGVRVTIEETEDAAQKGGRYSWEGFIDIDDANRDTVSGTARVLEADYVVGCDGARSMVRRVMGVGANGSDFDQKMCLAVFRSEELHEHLSRFPESTTFRALDPELLGYWMFFGRVEVGKSWFFHAPVPEDATPENYDFQALLERAAGVPFKVEFDHVGFWNLRVSVADQYQVGRVFIAGDAAHSHPPYGGLWPQQRAGGRREPGLEAGRTAAGLGRRHAAGVLRRGAAAGVLGDGRGLHSEWHPPGREVPGDLLAGEGRRGVPRRSSRSWARKAAGARRCTSRTSRGPQ